MPDQPTPLNFTAEMQTTYHLAVLQSAGESLRIQDDWQKLTEIQETTKTRIECETEQYHTEHADRINAVRKRLIDEGGAFNFDAPTPEGNDSFSLDTINKRAQDEVRHDHEWLIGQIENDSVLQVIELQDGVRQRDQSQGLAKDQFNQAINRREGQDRRAPARER